MTAPADRSTDHASDQIGLMRFIALFAIATLLLIYQVYVALSFGLILTPMSTELGLTTSTAGLVSAVFMLTICLLQLPAGLAVDRLKPGLVLAAATLVCAAGAALLGLAQSTGAAFAGRIVMGLGSAFAFVGALKIVGMIVSGSRFALTTGIWQVLYSLVVAGLAFTSAKLGLATHWRALMFGLAGVGVAIALVLLLTDLWLPRPQKARAARAPFLAQITAVVSNREVILAAVIFGLTFGPLLAYSDLWAIPNQLAWRNTTAQAAAIVGMIPIGMGVGSLLIGILVDRLRRPRLVGAGAALLGFVATAILLFGPDLPRGAALALAFLFGTGAAASLISLSHVRVFLDLAQVGTAIGFVSTVGYLVGGLLQATIGVLLDKLHTQPLTTSEFSDGLSPLLQCFLLAAVLMAVMRPWPRPDEPLHGSELESR